MAAVVQHLSPGMAVEAEFRQLVLAALKALQLPINEEADVVAMLDGDVSTGGPMEVRACRAVGK